MKLTFIFAAISMALGIMIGAFGAHGLKETLLTHGTLATFETGVQYHFYNTLGLFGLAWAQSHWQQKLTSAVVCVITGMTIFSWSLFILSITGVKWLGAITPIGGTVMIIGWIIAAVTISKK